MLSVCWGLGRERELALQWMDLLKCHHNCFGNRTAGYGVKDLDDSQLAEKKKNLLSSVQ